MKFKTWKTIRIGNGPKSFADYCKLLEKAGCPFEGGLAGDEPLDLQLLTTLRETEVSLANVSVAEIVIYGKRTIRTNPDAIYEEIVVRAQELGLGMCTLEIALELRLQYTDQPKQVGEWLNIAMKTFTVMPPERCFEKQNIFILTLGYGNESAYIAPARAGRFDHFFHTDRFVFRKI